MRVKYMLHSSLVLLTLAAAWQVTAQGTGPGLIIPNVTLTSGPEQQALIAARLMLGQLSDNFLGAGVQRNVTFCMDARGRGCPVGQRATVACTRGTEVYIVFNTTMLVQGPLVPDPSLLLSGVYEDQCSLQPVTACQPAVNQYVLGNFSSITTLLERAVNACSIQQPSIISCVGQNDNGGATAAVCGYWASQRYPSAQINVVTFASNWSVSTVNFAFIARYGRFVGYTLNVIPTVQQLLNSSFIRDSPAWTVSGTDCDSSPYCNVNQAVNTSCTLLEDGDPNGETQFLQSYPGAVVLYDRVGQESTPTSGGGQPPKQTAAVMWVPTSSALVFTFVANDVTAQNINPADYVEMTPLWEAAALELDPQSFAPYTKAFTASDAPLVPGEFETGTPMVVTDYLQRFARFQNVSSSKQQCKGLTGCYQYVSGSGEPNLVVCAGYGVGGGVAAVCAAWAAIKFPQAQVTLVNAGSPLPVGNLDFEKFLFTSSGNFFTLVNGIDPVPRAVACQLNRQSMEVASVATFYANMTGNTTNVDPFFDKVDCSYFSLPSSQKAPIPDGFCSSYRSEAFEADIIAPIRLPWQGPYTPKLFANDSVDLTTKYWEEPALGTYYSGQ